MASPSSQVCQKAICCTNQINDGSVNQAVMRYPRDDVHLAKV